MFVACAPDDQEPYRGEGKGMYLLKVGKGMHVGVAYGRFANHGLRCVSTPSRVARVMGMVMMDLQIKSSTLRHDESKKKALAWRIHFRKLILDLSYIML